MEENTSRERAASHLLSAMAWGELSPAWAHRPQLLPSTRLLVYWINIDTVDFFSFPQSGFLIELNLTQPSLSAAHDWQFEFTWVALFLRPRSPGSCTRKSQSPIYPQTTSNDAPGDLITNNRNKCNASKIRRLQILRSAQDLRSDWLPTKMLPPKFFPPALPTGQQSTWLPCRHTRV